MSDGFYRAFEDRHRGTLESVKMRQRVYLPLIRPLARHYPHAAAIDLGCGRGEWLELLAEEGFDALGIDLDDGMLAECRARGLRVRTEDAIAALRNLPDASQAVVSGMHLAEHIPFEVLQVLVQEALRVLLPAGLLILETPNPENIVVGTTNFYLDPTHNRPLPPLLLSFLPEYYGFSRVKILRLQEPVSLGQTRRFTLHDVLGGVSPDYAVVAQKSADKSLLGSVSQAFEPDYGVSLGELSNAYDNQIEQSIVKLNLTLQRVDRELGSRVSRLEKFSPVIQTGRQLRLLKAEGFGARARKISSKALRVAANGFARVLSAHPGLKRALVGIARKLGLYGMLASRLRPPPAPGETAFRSASAAEVGKILEDLPKDVRDTFGALDAEIARREKP